MTYIYEVGDSFPYVFCGYLSFSAGHLTILSTQTTNKQTNIHTTTHLVREKQTHKHTYYTYIRHLCSLYK